MRKKISASLVLMIIEELLKVYHEHNAIVTNDNKVDNNGALHDNKGRFTSKGGGNTILSESNKGIDEKIKALNNINWNKDNILPKLNKTTLKQYSLKDKYILLKKVIIDRNVNTHCDITRDETLRILANALYKTEAVLKGKSKRPNYYNFITRTDDEHSDLVTVELSEEKEHYEIVHFYIIRNKTRTKYEKDDKELNK